MQLQNRSARKAQLNALRQMSREPCFSGDEKRIVFERGNLSGISDLWTMDLAGGNKSRFTFDPSDDFDALWSPDGERIVWTSDRSGVSDLYQKPASGAGKDKLLLKSTTAKYPDDWSHQLAEFLARYS